MQDFDLGGGEGERVDDVLRPHAVARHNHESDGACLAGRREGAGEIGNDERIVTFRRAGERNGAALAEAPGDGIDKVHAFPSARASASRGALQRRIKRGVSW